MRKAAESWGLLQLLFFESQNLKRLDTLRPDADAKEAEQVGIAPRYVSRAQEKKS